MLAPRAAGWYNIACKIVPKGLTAMQIAAMMLSKQQAASSKQQAASSKQASRVSLPFFGIFGNRERGLFWPVLAVFCI